MGEAGVCAIRVTAESDPAAGAVAEELEVQGAGGSLFCWGGTRAMVNTRGPPDLEVASGWDQVSGPLLFLIYSYLVSYWPVCQSIVG